MASGIYQITNTVTGRFYIGSSIDVDFRIKAHKRCLKNNSHRNSYLQNSYNKHGVGAFTYKIIEYVSDVDKLIEREQYYIDSLGASRSKNGYNINPIAGSCLGVKRSDEYKKKASEIRKGTMQGENNPFYGKKHTKETIEKLKRKKVPLGENHHRATTTEKQAREIKMLLKEGKLLHKEIAEKVGVSVYVVNKIKTGYTWSHLKID